MVTFLRFVLLRLARQLAAGADAPRLICFVADEGAASPLFFVPPSHPLVSGGLSDDRARCVWALEGSTGPLTYGIGLVRFLTLRETSQTVSRETFAAGRTIILVYASRRNAKRDGRSPHCT